MTQTATGMPAPLLNALKEQKHPVLLLEGTRNVPEADREHLFRLGEQMARFLPNALFRSGNAPGSDQLFGAGVCRVGPSRMQIVAPYHSHRAPARNASAQFFSLDQMPDAEYAVLMETTLKASPDYAGLIKRYRKIKEWEKHTIKLAYLLRDTLKVVGSPAHSLPPATLGVFYVNRQSLFPAAPAIPSGSAAFAAYPWWIKSPGLIPAPKLQLGNPLYLKLRFPVRFIGSPAAQHGMETMFQPGSLSSSI